MAKNAFLSYTDDTGTHVFPINVMSYEQPLALSGSTAQSRLSRQFYPKTFSPSDITVKGRCDSQKDYQRLALFVRKHHLALVSTPNDVMFTRLDVNSTGYRRLMRLFIRGEDFDVRGWVAKNTISKRGVFEPAPEFNLAFTPVFDSRSKEVLISYALIKSFAHYNPEGAFSRPGVVDPIDTGDIQDAHDRQVE